MNLHCIISRSLDADYPRGDSGDEKAQSGPDSSTDIGVDVRFTTQDNSL